MADQTEAQKRVELEITEAAFQWARTVSHPSSLEAFRAGARWMAHLADARLNAHREQQPPANCPQCAETWWRGDPPTCVGCGFVAPGFAGSSGNGGVSASPAESISAKPPMVPPSAQQETE